jgi:hypothetical protein
LDSRKGGCDYFLSRDKVDRWAKIVLEEVLTGHGEVSVHTPLYARPSKTLYRAMKILTPAKTVGKI